MVIASKSLSRRAFIGGAIVLPALAAAMVGKARADNPKASQASMRYQSTPNGSMHCSECKFFIPAQDAQSNGSCQLVDGSISPSGYCIAFAPK